MREENLKNIRKRSKYSSYRGESSKVAPNILNRDFSTTGPDQKWATDVTQINIGMDMLGKALAKGRTRNGLILHSDQGWHNQHAIYQKSLRDHEIIQSMSRKGNCLDNDIMENFFGIMKSELLYPNTFMDMDHFKAELRKYIEYYNNDRIKLRLKGMSPVQYRTHNTVLS